jgi:hypothetical protein
MRPCRRSMTKPREKPLDMFAGAKAARLRPGDMAKLMRVSRVTASLWMNGHSHPHHLLIGRARRVLAAIDAAMKAADFPVPYDTSRRERGLYVSSIVTKHVKLLADKESVS